MFAILMLFLVPAVLAYSTGPPVSDAGLCTDMIPTGHNGGVSLATDTANPPYTITTSSDKYTAGGTVTGKCVSFMRVYIYKKMGIYFLVTILNFV